MMTAEQFLETLAEADLTCELLERQALAARQAREATGWLPEQVKGQRDAIFRAVESLGECNLALREHLLGPPAEGADFCAGRRCPGPRPAEAYRALVIELRAQKRRLRERIGALQEVVLKHVGREVGADVRRFEGRLTALLEDPEVLDAALQD